MIGAAAAAAVDFAFVAQAAEAPSPRALLALVGVWGTLALLALPVARPLQTAGHAARVGERATAAALAVWRGTGPESVPVAGRVVGAAIGLAIWLAAGTGLLWWLIATRNGPGLIAGTFMLVQLAVLAFAAASAMAVARLVHRLGRPRLRSAVVGIALLVVAGGIAGRLALLELVPDLGWRPGLVLGAAALALLGSRRVGGHPLALVGLALTPVVAGLGLQDGATRFAVARQAPAARGVMVRLMTASDFDRDGIPSLPDLRDCAPFDPAIHPFALDPPGDGVDQDCDGVDGGPVAEPLPPPEAGRSAGSRPNIILITIDSLRADHLSLYGYHRQTSPRLDGNSVRGVVFDRAWTGDAGTGPSLWGLMAGTAPFEAAVDPTEGWPPALLPEQVTLAEQLDDVGYRTEAIVCGKVFRKKHWGIRRGFDAWSEVCGKRRKHLAERVADRAVGRIERRIARTLRSPYFAWVHFYDPHQPYADFDDIDLADKTADGRTYRIGRYDEEILYTDRHVARLMEAAERLPGETWIFLTADHGENFGTHGTAPHARNLYRPVTHVPLLAWGPGARARRVKAPVAMIDLHPTALELAGVDPGSSATRRSLLSVIEGGPPDESRLVYQENSFARPLRHTRAVVSHRHQLIVDLTVGHAELYDLDADFDQQHDLYGTGVPEQAALEAAVGRFMTLSRLPPSYAR